MVVLTLDDFFRRTADDIRGQMQMPRVVNDPRPDRVIRNRIIRQVTFTREQNPDPGMQAVFVTEKIMNYEVGLVAQLQFKPLCQHPVEKIIGLALVAPDVAKINPHLPFHKNILGLPSQKAVE